MREKYSTAEYILDIYYLSISEVGLENYICYNWHSEVIN